MGLWVRFRTHYGLHVIPNNDLVEHVPNKTCVCGPKIDSFVGESGTVEWRYTHESLDRREDRES